ncbi:hypothetical protein ACFXB3_22700 [Streptomyces sp. NPDC059447]|uniref:hypothetical protein n=1 Tax=Streptomyces sp. NPDC059447 TaxID=3346834 RepID=UPI0036C79233
MNHKSQQVTVYEREKYGATAPWFSRTWVQETQKRQENRPTVYLPPADEELPEVECRSVSWWRQDE